MAGGRPRKSLSVHYGVVLMASMVAVMVLHAWWEARVLRGDDAALASGGHSYLSALLPTCPALAHAKITCPTWDPAQEDGGPDADLRVRWIARHQNARGRGCDEVNYLFRSHHDFIGFGAGVYLNLVSSLYMALYSDRVFLLDDATPFRYADCEPQTWECYFLPLSRCTTADVEASIESGRRSYGGDFLNPSDHVIRASKVRDGHRGDNGSACRAVRLGGPLKDTGSLSGH